MGNFDGTMPIPIVGVEDQWMLACHFLLSLESVLCFCSPPWVSHWHSVDINITVFWVTVRFDHAITTLASILEWSAIQICPKMMRLSACCCISCCSHQLLEVCVGKEWQTGAQGVSLLVCSCFFFTFVFHPVALWSWAHHSLACCWSNFIVSLLLSLVVVVVAWQPNNVEEANTVLVRHFQLHCMKNLFNSTDTSNFHCTRKFGFRYDQHSGKQKESLTFGPPYCQWVTWKYDGAHWDNWTECGAVLSMCVTILWNTRGRSTGWRRSLL